MRRTRGMYGYENNNEETVIDILTRNKNQEQSDKKSWLNIIVIGTFITGIALGPFIIFGINNMNKRKAGEEIAKSINVIPTDKLDAECFATSITTGDNDSNNPESFRAVSIDNVYCKPNTESLAVKNKHGIGVTIYEGDESNQILYYKEFKEGNNIFYFNIRERN